MWGWTAGCIDTELCGDGHYKWVKRWWIHYQLLDAVVTVCRNTLEHSGKLWTTAKCEICVMLTCACILPDTRCWLLSTGIPRLMCFITSTRKVLSNCLQHMCRKHSMSSADRNEPWNQPWGNRWEVSAEHFLDVCFYLSSQVWVSSVATDSSFSQGHLGQCREGRTWLRGHFRAEASMSKSCKILPGANCCLWGSKGPSAFHSHSCHCCSKLPYKEVGAF